MPQALSPDIRLMNALSSLLILAFAAMVLAVALAWLMRQSLFALSAIEIRGDLVHTNAVTLRANVMPKLAGNFFTADLSRTKAAFEAVPWVRRAVVQRQFPNRLKVTLQEHQAAAFWGPEADPKLVNTFGEVFEANQGEVELDDLPQLSGPTGQAAWVMQAYERLAPRFERLGGTLERLELNSQASWRARLDSGAVIELGGGTLEEVDARLLRFLATLNQVSQRYGRDLESADLRYSSGYALKLKGVTTVNLPDNSKPGKR
jgi:cell division protein FtsQ